MARLFIFAIGGTGSRVLKSLTMLLAAGVKPETATEFEIVPIIIDPHKANKDLMRAVRLLDNYQRIAAAVGAGNGFFDTKITTLNNLTIAENRLKESFTFNLQQVTNTKFRNYIDFNELSNVSKASQSLAEILFSGKSIGKRGEAIDLLDIEMEIGFVGNPNIGSIVLNQFKDSDEFREVASNFNDEDRIFIISSIFGGTGAAGFPTILKNIRDAMKHAGIAGKGFLQNAKIGALTALPYFNLKTDENSPIQKSDFIAKTKSALYYYKDNVSGNNSVNALYYIADNYSGSPYENDPGDGGQRNNAHFVELASALAIIDFLEIPDDELKCVAGEAEKPIYREFNIKQNVADIKFSDLEIKTEDKISLPLAQFTLFKKFLDQHLKKSSEEEPWRREQFELNSQFFSNSFYRTNLSEFLDAYGEWLKEMSENRRGFSPFELDSTLESLISGRPAKSNLWRGKVYYNLFTDRLNKMSDKQPYVSAPQKLINLFYKTTKDILESRFGFKK